MATNSACVNATPGSSLASACACQAAANALADSLTKYNAAYEKYAINQANYTAAVNKYNSDHAQWVASQASRRAELTNELKTMACGGCGTNQGCNVLGSGWVSTANPLACSRDYFGTPWGCNHICQRTDQQVNVDLGTWARSNPEPQPPPPVPAFSLQVPNGNNITCCSQQFSGITADSVSFNNILQNCNQTIQQTIAAAASKPSVPNPANPPKPVIPINPGSPTKPTTSSSTSIGIILGIFCGLLILLAAIIFIGWIATRASL